MLIVAALAVGPLAACGGDDDSSNPSAAGEEGPPLEDVAVMEGSTVEVDALDNSFNHQNIQVGEGTTVVWENKGRQDHDIVPADEDGWGVDAEGFGPGEGYEHTFEEPGTYRYYCSLHGDAEAGMVGAVVVEEASAASEGKDTSE